MFKILAEYVETKEYVRKMTLVIDSEHIRKILRKLYFCSDNQ